MSFREWLLALERAPDATPSQNVRMNPDSSYGGARTMLPISLGLQNRVAASVVGGIGAARKKISVASGAEPGSVPQLGELEDIRKQPIQSIYMPLQLPEDWDSSQNVLYAGKSLQNRVMRLSQKPDDDSLIWNVNPDDKTSIVGAGGSGMKTKLFSYNKSAGPQSDPISYQTAVNFTQELMKVSLTARLAPYSHLLDLENPHIRDRQEIPVESDQQGMMHSVMLCSFVFNTRNKDTRIGGNDWEAIQDRFQGGRSNSPTASQRTQRTPGRITATARPRQRTNTGPVPAGRRPPRPTARKTNAGTPQNRPTNP